MTKKTLVLILGGNLNPYFPHLEHEIFSKHMKVGHNKKKFI